MTTDVIVGWKAIVDAARIPRTTAMRMAMRDVDPMPLRKLHGGVYARAAELAAWLDRQDRPYCAGKPGNTGACTNGG